jgi:small subunit ribosomal protein S3
MTHTVHPYAHRLGIIRDWKSRWFSKTPAEYRRNVMIDAAIRRFLKKRLRGMYITSTEIERTQNTIRILVKTSRPGLVIGRGGEGSQRLTKEIEKMLERIKLPSPGAGHVSAGKIPVRLDTEGLEKRQTFRRVLKQTVEKVMANRDVLGVRIGVAGRLGGAEMSRQEEIKRGRVPLQSLRADIDFAREMAYLPYGVIGVKVWIYRGDIFDTSEKK